MNLSSLFLFILLSTSVLAQEIVVSEVFNAATPGDEWSELIVTSDNLDMRNYTFGDNNASTSGWQTPITFKFVSLWEHVRRGTIIVIRHRGSSSSDTNADDGFLDLGAEDAAYFSGGSFGSTLDLAAGGDLLQI